MPLGHMRLHWVTRQGNSQVSHTEDFPCLHDVLERAGRIYGTKEGNLTRLENWMGEDVTPRDQLVSVAELRAKAQAIDADQNAMETNPIYGSF